MAGTGNPIYMVEEKPGGLLLDSNLRYLNGLSVGLGVCTIGIIGDIKRRSSELRIICFIIFIGAIGRFLSIASDGFAPVPFNILPFFEAILPAVFVFWQSRIADPA